MRLSNGSYFVLHTIALTMIVVQGKVREADALIHKPKILPGPAWSATHHWPPQRRKAPVNPESQQPYNTHQREQSQKSMEMNMAHGNIGIQEFRSSPLRRLVLASMLTVAAMFKTKALLSFLFNGLYKPYQNSLVQNPLVTKVCTGAILAIAGDAVAQATSNEGTSAYDKRRAISFAVFDSCYRFFQHNMFPIVIRLGQGNVISKVLPKFLAPAAAAIEQTALYQFVIVPCLYYPIFFVFTGFIQGLSVSQSVDRMKRQFFPCWRKNLMFWIPTQMVLFGLVAEKWQIPFACLMGMLWSMILSKTAGNSRK